MKNIINGISDALAGLGLKGSLSLGCLGIGIAGLVVGANSSYKINDIVSAISKIENAELNDEAQKSIKDNIDKLTKQLKDSDNMESVVKELNRINKKFDEIFLTPSISTGYQSDAGEIVENYKSFFENLNRKIEELTDQVLNNQVELTDINNQTFEILEILKGKKEELKGVQTINNNLIITDDKNTVNTVNTITGSNSGTVLEHFTHSSITENSLIEFELENSSTNVDTISGEILESDKVEIIENNSYHWLFETSEETRTKIVSGSNSAIDFEYLTHGSITENSLIDFNIENDSVSVDTISGEIVESGKVEATENNSNYLLVEIGEESGFNTNSGFNAFIDVVYDSSSIEFEFNSTVGEISGGFLKIEVTEEQ